MDKCSRRWFDNAYNFTGGVFPFDMVCEKYTEEDLMRYTRYSLGEGAIKRIINIASNFLEKLPSEEDFQEEKEAILERLVPNLQRKLYYVDTAVMFGRVRGDIDIGLISPNGIQEDELSNVIYTECDIAIFYPILDCDGLYFFRSKNGAELAKKIIKSRLIAGDIENTENLDSGEWEYIKDTIHKARLLWGDENELCLMKSFFEEHPKLVKP